MTFTSDRPQWQVIYDHLSVMRVGELVEYETLQDLLPGVAASSVRTAFHGAARRQLEDQQWAFENIRGVGYRKVHPREQDRLAKGHERRSRRQVRRAVRLVENVKVSMLTQEERRKMREHGDHLRRLEEFARRLSRRTDNVEERVAVTEKESGVLADRVQALETLLLRHGITNEK